MKTNVNLKANDKASRRTRNRIREHGPSFRAIKSGNCQGLGDGLHLLVRAEDGWSGWLPWNEVNNFSLDN
jgi:hypothetical protein